MKKLICRIVKYLVDILSEIFTWCHDSINAPTLLTATLVPPNIDLAWVDNSDNETGFNIFRSDDGSNFTQIDTVPADTTTYTDTTATPGQDYWYEVQAFNDDATSDFSNIVDTGIAFTEVHYGLLYNWYAVNTGILSPAGWHVPSEAEWDTLGVTLGGDTIAGGKLKETGFTYWNTPNTGATNETGFNGRGSGYRNDSGNFTQINIQNFYWASDTFLGASHFRRLDCINDDLSGNDSGINRKVGASVIFIKDDAIDSGILVDYDDNVYPTVTIGSQVWMARPLIVKHYNDGTAIPEVTDGPTWSGLATGAWCYYNNDSSNQ